MIEIEDIYVRKRDGMKLYIIVRSMNLCQKLGHNGHILARHSNFSKKMLILPKNSVISAKKDKL